MNTNNKKHTKKHSASDASYEEYMERVGKETIPCYEPSLGEEEITNLKTAIESGWLSEKSFTREFEDSLAKLCERTHALTFSHGTDALIAGMRALGIGNGDEVIIPSLTHSADPNSVAMVGATPIFADVKKNTLCLSVESVRAVRTPKTKAILFVAAYGNAEGIYEISEYAKQEGLYLINDCAPALFGTYKGRPIASYGDFSMLSFFVDKTITTGEGGMLLTNQENLIEGANIIKHDGRRERGVDLIEKKGYNFRITELQTAVGVAQLKKAPHFVQRKKEILRRYSELLTDISSVEVFQFSKDGDSCPHRIVIFVPDAQKLIEDLSAKGIGARTLFMPMHRQPVYNTNQKFPITEELYLSGVCLPSAPTLTDEQIMFVCDTIKSFYTKS